MNTNHKSIVFAVSVFFVLCTSISAAPGDLDPTFGSGGKLSDWDGWASGVAIQPDGKIVVVGGSDYSAFRVARYTPDGTPDTTFGGTGKVTTVFGGNQSNSMSVVIQLDGKILVGGLSGSNTAGNLALARYNPDGSLDTTFGGGSGKVLTPLQNWFSGIFWRSADVAVQPDGKIIGISGLADGDDNYNEGLLVRYHSDGSLDTSFGTGGSVLIELALLSVIVQPADGKIVANTSRSGRIARFNTNGCGIL